MSDNKKIDRLFQEKFKDFEVTPDKSVWKSINANLNKKKKERRLIPLWWKLSGIAAGIILLIAIGSYFAKDSGTTQPETLVETPSNEVNSEIKNDPNTTLEDLDSQSTLVETPTNTNLNSKIESNLTAKSNQEKITLSNHSNKKLESKQGLNKNNTALLNSSIIANSQEESQSKSNSLGQSKEKINLLEDATDTNYNAITQSNITPEAEDNVDKAVVEEKLNDLNDAIASNETEEEIKPEVEPIKRWSINPNVAPVYFNSFGDGSTIHSQFINNSKSGKINMSFGVNASYALNNKLSVRTGVSKVNLGYSTNNVAILTGTVSGFLNENLYKNIAFSNSNNSVMFLNINQSVSLDFPTALPNKIKGEIDQEIGFIEIPFELQYKLLDNKFGMSVIGGVSTLFLNNNELFSLLDGEKTLIGKATNINKTSFSANFGVGMNYNITKKINLNIEPTFKYQLNTFDNTSGDVKPYFIGIYSGIKYKF
jgi:hypothetical protein